MKEIVINKPYGFIYITTNLVNGKRYLGQKKFDNSNKWKHYLGSGKAFKNAVNYYGKENFQKNIIYICYSEEELNKTEYDLSVFMNVVDDNNWYNLEYGGRGCSGYHHTDETKKHLSEVLSGENHPWYGKHHSDESKRKISESNTNPSEETREKLRKTAKEQMTEERKSYLREINTGRTVTEETKEKMRQSHLGLKNPHNEEWRRKQSEVQKERSKNPENNPMFGKHQTEETKLKISEKAKERFANKKNHPMYGRRLSDEQKQILSEYAKQRVGKNNSNARKVIRLSDSSIYDFIGEAAKCNNMCRDTMTKKCKAQDGFMYYNEYIIQQNDLENFNN